MSEQPDICPRCVDHGVVYDAQPVGYRSLGPNGWAYLPIEKPCPECAPQREPPG